MADPVDRAAVLDACRAAMTLDGALQRIRALPAVTPVPDADAIRSAALREAAARATARWAARREHADRLAEMDYPEAMIDAKTVSAKADEAEMIANEILALITEKPHDRA